MWNKRNRARGVTATQRSAKVADAGSSPVGSILRICGRSPFWGDKAEILSPRNLTLGHAFSILKLGRALCTTFLMAPGDRSHSCLGRPACSLASYCTVNGSESTIAGSSRKGILRCCGWIAASTNSIPAILVSTSYSPTAASRNRYPTCLQSGKSFWRTVHDAWQEHYNVNSSTVLCVVEKYGLVI